MSADPRDDSAAAMASANEAMRRELDELKSQLAHAQQQHAAAPPPRPTRALSPWMRALIVLAILAPIGVMILGAAMAANLLRSPQIPSDSVTMPQR